MENNILITESLFIDLIEYFDERQDADGSSDGFTANKEMRLLIRLLNPAVVQSQASLASHSYTETNY
jgi:hypothetical protein